MLAGPGVHRPMTFSNPPPTLRTGPPLSNMAALHSFPGVSIPALYHVPPPPLPATAMGVRAHFPPPHPHHTLQARGATPSSLPGPAGKHPALSPNQGMAAQTSWPTGHAGHANPASSALKIDSALGGARQFATSNSRPGLVVATHASSPSPATNPAGAAVALSEPVATDTRETEDKKRRRRRRRRGRGQGSGACGEGGSARDGSPGLEHAPSSSNVSESTLHFEDVDEFPDLVSAGRGFLPGEECGGADRGTLSGTSLSYSDVIKATWSKAGSQSRTQSLSGSAVSGDDDDNASNHTGASKLSKLSKRARKRRRRREQANQAAEVELAEISLEQQWLQQVGLRKSPTGPVAEFTAQPAGKVAAGGKKFHQPIAFDIAAMIDAIQ
ncbi:hypothetical protein EGW08_020404, partial [Elysia chlorotica]